MTMHPWGGAACVGGVGETVGSTGAGAVAPGFNVE